MPHFNCLYLFIKIGEALAESERKKAALAREVLTMEKVRRLLESDATALLQSSTQELKVRVEEMRHLVGKPLVSNEV